MEGSQFYKSDQESLLFQRRLSRPQSHQGHLSSWGRNVVKGGMLRAKAPRQDVLGTWEHEEVAWVAAVKSRPLGVGTASLTWQTVSSGEPGAREGSVY